MTNRVQKNINQSSEGKVHCRNTIGIEIPTVKLQKNRGGILSTDVVFGTNQDRQIEGKSGWEELNLNRQI
jgi:hypothetical protein